MPKNGSTKSPAGGNVAAAPPPAAATPAPPSPTPYPYPNSGARHRQHYPSNQFHTPGHYPPGHHQYGQAPNQYGQPTYQYGQGSYGPPPHPNFQHHNPAPQPFHHGANPYGGSAHSQAAQNPFVADHYSGANHLPPNAGPGAPHHGPTGYRSALPYNPNAPNISYYVFSQLWPNGHCMTAIRNPCQNLNYEADLWTIRGFWPAVARSDRHISFCRGTALQPLTKKVELKPQFQHNLPATHPSRHTNLIDSPTLSELDRVWPNLDFSPNPEQKWGREYRRHGACSPFDSSIYFHTAIDLHNRYNIFRIFEESRIYPDDLYTYRAPELHQAIIDNLGFRGALYCKRKQIKDGSNSVWVNVLYEVRLCLDTDLMPMNCPAFDVRSDLNVLRGVPIPCYNDVLYPNYHYADSTPAYTQQQSPGAAPVADPAQTQPQIPNIQVQPVIQLPTTFVLPNGQVLATQPLVPGNPQAGKQMVVIPGQESQVTGRGGIIGRTMNITLPGGRPPPGTSEGRYRELRIDHPDLPASLVVHVPKNMKPGSRATFVHRAPVLPPDAYTVPSDVQYPAQRPYPSRYPGSQGRRGHTVVSAIYHHGVPDQPRMATISLPQPGVAPKSQSPNDALLPGTSPIVQQPIKKRPGFAPIRTPGSPPSAAVHGTINAPAGVLPRPREGRPLAGPDSMAVQASPPQPAVAQQSDTVAAAPVSSAADQPVIHVYLRNLRPQKK